MTMIAIEGFDNSGKDTTGGIVRTRLVDNSISCLVINEPGATKFGMDLKDVLTNNRDIDECSKVLLYAASMKYTAYRIGKLDECVDVLIQVRSALSTYVYQGIVGNLSLKWISELLKSIDILQPDVTFYLQNTYDDYVESCKKKNEAPLSDEVFDAYNSAYRCALNTSDLHGIGKVITIGSELSLDDRASVIVDSVKELIKDVDHEE